MAWAEAYLHTKWHLDPSSHLATTNMGQKLGALPFGVRIKHDVARAEAYLRTKWHLDPSSRLATIDMGHKLGVLCPLFGEGELGPHLTQCRVDRGLPPYQVTS